ncbi:unnamed protein product [Phytophthora fragariaefolia]|uniref:Unnamed protein product n=1 Tax=Phytophthora fragariaefolia TaxID=1490495 RepID=A0A9W6WTZ8_9STRA|nr:unnamed protein product [Phytophthora fragariaefolia]
MSSTRKSSLNSTGSPSSRCNFSRSAINSAQAMQLSLGSNPLARNPLGIVSEESSPHAFSTQMQIVVRVGRLCISGVLEPVACLILAFMSSCQHWRSFAFNGKFHDYWLQNGRGVRRDLEQEGVDGRCVALDQVRPVPTKVVPQKQHGLLWDTTAKIELQKYNGQCLIPPT